MGNPDAEKIGEPAFTRRGGEDCPECRSPVGARHLDGCSGQFHESAVGTVHTVEPHQRRVLAALEVLGWPDDRDGSAHVEEDGHEVTPAGHYWSVMEDVLRAADAAGLHQDGGDTRA